MAANRENLSGSDGPELATRVAWLYYEAQLTQAKISADLQIPPAKVQRLIARARRDGLVRILIEGDLAGCAALERELSVRRGLRFCRVVPAIAGQPVFSSLGRAAASYLVRVIETRRHRTIGVGHGRTLAAMVDHMPHLEWAELTLVSVLGGVPRRVGDNPFDVVHALAEKTNASAWVMPVPFYAETPADRAVMLRQRGVAETLRLAEEAGLYIMGVGEVAETASLCRSTMVSPSEIAEARRAGAVAEAFGHFFGADGRLVASALHERVIALNINAMRGREVLVVAGGEEKRAAIDAVLKSGLPTALITDEATALHLVGPIQRSTGTT